MKEKINIKKHSIYNIYIKYICAFVLVLFCFSFKSIFADSDSTYNIKQYNINATIMDNGNIHVEEYIKYDITENINGLYRDIMYNYKFDDQKNDMKPTSSRYQASDINSVLVYVSNKNFSDMDLCSQNNEEELKKGDNLKYSISSLLKNGYIKRIKLYAPEKSGNVIYVKYVYNIVDAVVKYNDANEIYWNFVGKDWNTALDNFSLSVYWNKLINKNDVKIYPHSYAKMNSFNVFNDHFEMTYNKINAGTALDVRMVLPQNAVTNASKQIDEAYNYNELNNIENSLSHQKKYHFISIYINYGLLIFAFLSFVIEFVIYLKYSNKNKKRYKDIAYYRDLPESNFSLEDSIVIYQNYYGISNPNLLTSILLKLCNDKYILLDAKKKQKKLLGQPEYEYNMKLNDQKDFSKLTEFELSLINLIFNDKYDKSVDIAKFKYQEIELNKRLKDMQTKIPKNEYSYEKYIQGEIKRVKNKFYSSNFKKYNLFIKISFLIFFVGAILSIIAAKISKFEIIPYTITMIFAGIIYFLIMYGIAKSSYSLRPEYSDYYEKLVGLKKYLSDYSLMKTRYPIEIKLWEYYMVYATLFSVADKVIKELKSQYLSQGYDEDMFYTTHPVLGISNSSAYFSSNISYSTGTSSSGGYTSGGSGGGRRRRRPEVAHFNY